MIRISSNASRILLFMFLGCAFVVVSCQGNLKDTEELRKYVADPAHGLNMVEQVKQVQVQLTYLPAELMTSGLGAHKGLTKGKYFFILRFSKDGKELLSQIERSNYGEMVQVLSFRMSSYISISMGESEPVQLEDCIFTPTYGIDKENSLLLVFNNEKLKNAKQLKLTINEFGLGLGNIHFTMNPDDINAIPKVSI